VFHTIPDLLTPEEVNHLLEFSKTHLFSDGKGSNEEFELKNNLQANPQDPAAQQASAIVQNALFRNEWVRDIVIPKSLASPMITKYTPGMEYGEHVDTHVVTGSIPVRVDISCTVFLNDPASYDGGELIVRLADKTITIKEKAGTAFLYPSANQYHRVAPVTRGERIVAITFLQSHIRDQSKRAILYELQGFLNEYGESLTSEAQMQLEYVRTNLMRMWYED